MSWLVINIVAFLGTPLGLIFGWIAYSRQRKSHPGIRTNISLVAISGASLSVGLLVFSLIWARANGLGSTNSTIHALTTAGIWMSFSAVAISLGGHVRALLPIILASAGSVLLWYGLTVQ